MIRVLLVDDHPVVRAGYLRLLSQDTDIQVVAEAPNAEEAYAAFVTHAPDVTITDLSLPGLGGLGLATGTSAAGLSGCAGGANSVAWMSGSSSGWSLRPRLFSPPTNSRCSNSETNSASASRERVIESGIRTRHAQGGRRRRRLPGQLGTAATQRQPSFDEPAHHLRI